MYLKNKIRQTFIRASFVNNKTILISRVILGSIFIIASINKLQNISSFTNFVVSYEILPTTLSVIYGNVVPWLELIIGVFLILNIYPKQISFFGISLVISFIVSTIYKLTLGINGNCGCFGSMLSLTLFQSFCLDIAMIVLFIFLCARKSNPSTARQYNTHKNYLKYVLGFSKHFVTISAIALLIALIPTIFTEISNSDYRANNVDISTTENVLNDSDRLLTTYTNQSFTNQIEFELRTYDAVLVIFYTESCSVCDKQKSVVKEIEQEFLGTISFIWININKNETLVKTYTINKYPTMLIITKNSSNKPIIQNELIGYFDIIELKSVLGKYICYDTSSLSDQIIYVNNNPG